MENNNTEIKPDLTALFNTLNALFTRYDPSCRIIKKPEGPFKVMTTTMTSHPRKDNLITLTFCDLKSSAISLKYQTNGTVERYSQGESKQIKTKIEIKVTEDSRQEDIQKFVDTIRKDIIEKFNTTNKEIDATLEDLTRAPETTQNIIDYRAIDPKTPENT